MDPPPPPRNTGRAPVESTEAELAGWHGNSNNPGPPLEFLSPPRAMDPIPLETNPALGTVHELSQQVSRGPQGSFGRPSMLSV